MVAEHRLELFLYAVGILGGGIIIGFQLARGRRIEVIGGIGMFVLVAVALTYQTRKETRL